MSISYSRKKLPDVAGVYINDKVTINRSRFDMGLDTNYEELPHSKNSPGLIFDTEGVTLIGRYNDELSAYRARRQWIEILNTYFLLEHQRDYEMVVLSSPEVKYFALNCFFTSACGRYAFWRLINEQAPEAELKLCETSLSRNKTSKNFLSTLWRQNVTTEPTPWVLTTSDDNIEAYYESPKGAWNRIQRFFRKFFS